MDSKTKEINELIAKNEKLREQFSTLLDSYARLELTDLKRNQQAENQKRLIDFIQRIAKRLDDDDLLDVLVEEFLIELQADRVSYILPGSGPSRRLAVSNEAVEKNVKRLALPYFISSDKRDDFSALIYQCLDENDLVVSKWKKPVNVKADNSIQAAIEQNFQMAMEEEFNVVPKVKCLMAIAFPINTKAGGESVICLQRIESRRSWSQPQMNLFRDMCRYAGLLLEQTQMMQQIKDLKDQMSSIVQSMPSAIVGMDLLGTVTMWTGRAAEFLEIGEKQALGKVFWEIQPQYHFISNALMDVMGQEGERGLNFEILPYKRKNGSIVHHQATLFSMFYSNRGELALRIDDVTKQVELNNQLFHAQRMETVGTLAGGLAHDFNNILGGIVGTLSLMKQRTLRSVKSPTQHTKSKQDLEDMEIIENCALRASDMVKRLLSLSRKTLVDMEPIEFNAVVENVATLCGASFESKIIIEKSIPRKKLWISGNVTQLEQCFLNICVNARDAMKMSGGRLRLSLSEFKVSERFRKKHSCNEKKLARLKIADTGGGIPLEDQDKIFDPFFTTKSNEQGTGLGLSIVEKIIKEHEGYIEVDSRVGTGTSFNLYFKRTTAAPQYLAETPKSEEQGSGDVLVVDDDEIMRKTISRILYGMGYAVATAASGATAVQMCEAGLHFNLIVLDVDMPVLSGLDIFRIIRKSIPEMHFLFCTGRQHQYRMQDVLSENHTWLINKPFSQGELAKMVKTAIGER